MFRNYPQNILDLFARAINGNEKAFKALMTTEKRPELAAFSNAIRGDEKAEIWLKARVGLDWWLMCKALHNDEVAFKKKKQKEDKFDVCFVLACRKQIEGKYWLSDNNYSHFLPICKAVTRALDTADRQTTFWLYYDSIRKLY
jgi:hypothetical protein